jgi:hypothetical protein
MTGRALDDEAEDVRRIAFGVRVLTHPAVAAALERRLLDAQHTLTEILRRVAILRRTGPGKEVTDAELADARRSLRLPEGEGTSEFSEGELEPLNLAMSSRAPDTALLGAVAMLTLFFMGPLSDALGIWAAVLWMVLAAVGMALVMSDKREEPPAPD